MKRNLAAALILIAMTAAPPAWAQGKASDMTDLQALRAAVKSDKKALVTSSLELTDAEAKKFWPIYDAYQRKLDAANRRVVLVVKDMVEMNKPLSNAYAKNLAVEMVAADEAEIKARRTLHNRLMRGVPTRVLPPRKAARYLQLESKIRAVLAYDIAATIPLVK